MSTSLLDLLAREIGRLLEPIPYALENPKALERLLASVGVTSPNDEHVALTNALSTVGNLTTQIDEFAARPSPSLSDIIALLELSRDAFTAVRALDATGVPAHAFEDLGKDLANFLVANYLFTWHPLARDIAALLTLIEPADERGPRLPIVHGSQLLREPFYLDRFRFDRIVDLLRDPSAALRSEYGNTLATVDDANAIARKLFPRLQRVLRTLDVPCRYGFDPADADLLGEAAPLLDHALIIYAEDALAGAPAEAGVVLTLSPADRGDLGLVVSPFGALTSSRSIGRWTLELSLTAGVDVLAYGRHGLTLVASTSTAQVDGSISGTLAAPDDGPAFILGTPTGSRLEAGGALLKAETSLSEAQQSLALLADVSSAAIVIAPGDGDGFLRSILPAEGLQAKFDLGLAWSNERGLTFRGAGSLDATVPVGISVGGVLTVPTIHLILQARETGLLAEVSASVGASIGPVHTLVERVGIATVVTFPEAGGNLGVADLDLRFKPPNGVGLSIDAAGVTGGGFLDLDPERGQYAGVVQLNLEGGIAVNALGLIATRLPDGSKGYSLLALITAEGFKPIPLPLGFKLTGIGGLLAINRTFDEDVLRAGLKNRTLDSVMFPQDPIRNTSQILSSLNRVFPPAIDHHLFGPMAQITWGTPPLITADLALVLEFGARLRLLILAQVVAILPKRENDLVRLQMDAIGVLDFDQGTASLDATLYDSKLLKKFVLTGDMAMRLKWEASPNFALAVGGLHPAFNPPPNFPKLERIALNLSAGNNPRLRCEAYFALTSNTVQFGARAELYAASGGFSIQGDTGFDVLIQLDPFHFLADFDAQLQLKRGSINLFKVRVEGALAGPRPLHLKGKATFEICWFDHSVRIDKTLVEGELPPRPEPVDVLAQLKEALGNSGNWMGRLPDGQRPMVSLRAKPGAATDVLLHPLGTLIVKQGVVPLNLDISRFGQATPAGARRFTISSVSPGEENQTTESVEDFFAPAQFFEMSDDEKLSRPSFESMAAGISIGSDKLTFTANPNDWLEVDTIAYDTVTVDNEQDVPRRSGPEDLYELSSDLLDKQARFGAAGNSDLRRTGKAKYRTTRVGHKLVKEGWSIVATDDLTVQPAPGIEAGTSTSYSEAAQALRKMEREDPTKAGGLKILRLSEVRGSIE